VLTLQLPASVKESERVSSDASRLLCRDITVLVKHGTHVRCLKAHERTGRVGFLRVSSFPHPLLFTCPGPCLTAIFICRRKIFPQWAYNTTGIQGPTNLRSDLYPTARVSGVKLNVNMNYFNHGQEAKAGYKNDETCVRLSSLAYVVHHPYHHAYITHGS